MYILKKRNSSCKKYPINTGKKWSDAENKLLFEEFRKGIDIHTIAKNHNRTIGGITARIGRIICNMVVNKKSMEEIINKETAIYNKKKPKQNENKIYLIEKEILEINNNITNLTNTIKTIIKISKIEKEILEIKNNINDMTNTMNAVVRIINNHHKILNLMVNEISNTKTKINKNDYFNSENINIISTANLYESVSASAIDEKMSPNITDEKMSPNITEEKNKLKKIQQLHTNTTDKTEEELEALLVAKQKKM